jgi:hypothetical protein
MWLGVADRRPLMPVCQKYLTKNGASGTPVELFIAGIRGLANAHVLSPKVFALLQTHGRQTSTSDSSP